MEKKKISMAVIRRLPKYHRYLRQLLNDGVERISSKELSQQIGFTASQIRQDLNNFGDFGQQGYGYNVELLYGKIGEILGLKQEYNTIVVGGGNLGQAIANYTYFESIGFNVKAIFERNPKLVGLKIRGVDVLDIDDIEEFLKDKDIDIAVLCIPKDTAQDIADKVVANGVTGIWNFAPVDLKVKEDVVVENVNLSESLLTLTCLMNGERSFKTTKED